MLVSNTGQTVDRRLLSAIGSRNKTYSQGFETGTNPGGYSLASVGVYVYVETLGTGETFTVHIYTANSAGAPDTLAYTLTSPASYADRAVNTFTAPAGATLDADTDYFVVFEGTADESLDFILGLTSSDEQDRGSRSGWEIEDTNRYQGLMQTAGNSYQISVNGSAVPTDVPSTWALKPTGLTTGDTFRLLFLSSTKRDASSTDIADYNTFIQTTADAGHTAIQGYSDGFRVVGCTSSADARDNTRTIYTASDKGVSIYWLNGARAADDYEDFYDGDMGRGSPTATIGMKTGTDGPDYIPAQRTTPGPAAITTAPKNSMQVQFPDPWAMTKYASEHPATQAPQAPSTATPQARQAQHAQCTAYRRSSKWLPRPATRR